MRARSVVLGVVAACLVACSSSASPTVYKPDPGLRSSPDGSADASGCNGVTSDYSDAGCRVDWSCADAGLLELVCTAADAGSTCACLVGEQLVQATAVEAGACSSGAASGLASTVCGWTVP